VVVFLFSYTPAVVNVPTNLGTASYVYEEVLDIKQSSVFEICLPFQQAQPWLHTASNAEPDQVGYFGTVSMRILNPLVASSTVSSQIEVLLYAAACDSFQLAGLMDVKYPAFVPEMDFEPQSVVRASKMIGGSAPTGTNVLPSAACIGESFTSVRQLVKMARPVSLPFTITTDVASAKIYPYLYGLPGTNGGGSIGFRTSTGDYLCEVGSGFVHVRGGVRLMVPETQFGSYNSMAWTTVSAVGAPLVSAASRIPLISVDNFDPNANGTLLSPQVFRSGVGGLFDVIFPHTAPTSFRLNYSILNNADADVVPGTVDQNRRSINIRMNFGTTLVSSGPVVYRSGADDIAYSFFIGFPAFLKDLYTP